MTPDRLAEIEARANAATKGPWEVHDGNSWRRIGVQFGGSVIEPIKQRDGHPDLHARREDLELAAHSRADIPDLIAEIRRLNSIIDDLRPKSEEVGP